MGWFRTGARRYLGVVPVMLVVFGTPTGAAGSSQRAACAAPAGTPAANATATLVAGAEADTLRTSTANSLYAGIPAWRVVVRLRATGEPEVARLLVERRLFQYSSSTGAYKLYLSGTDDLSAKANELASGWVYRRTRYACVPPGRYYSSVKLRYEDLAGDWHSTTARTPATRLTDVAIA